MRKFLLNILGVCCFAFLAISLSVSAQAATYSDIEGHWNQAVIEKWSDSGLLNGYPDGSFGPNDSVTRGQLAAVLYRIWGCDPVEDGFAYSDFPKTSWCYEALNTMHMYGIALNTEDKMLPDAPLTREEAFYMISKAFLVEKAVVSTTSMKNMPDKDETSPLYASQIAGMVKAGYVNGSTDGYLYPKQGITRAEVMKIIDNMFDVLIDEPGTYVVPYEQNTLVLCSDVTLKLADPNGSTMPSRIYLMCPACKGGVSICRLSADAESTRTILITVSQEAAVYEAESEQLLRDTRKTGTVLSNRSMPDTRFAGGFGSKDFPYLISTAEQFKLLGDYFESSEYYASDLSIREFKLLCDIDLGELSAPIGDETNDVIQANLDGDGHSVTYQMTDVTLEKSTCGLFYQWDGDCSNLSLKGSVKAAFSDNAGQSALSGDVSFGGFAGFLTGTMENCSCNMEISIQAGGTNRALAVGGLIGTLSVGRDMIGCSFSGSIQSAATNQTCNIWTGGLVGGAYACTILTAGDFTDCYATGSLSVSGGYQSAVGGIAGHLSITENNSAAQTAERLLKMNRVTNCWSTVSITGTDADFQCDAGGLVGQLYAGTIQTSWSKPTITVSGDSDGTLMNLGGIAGSNYAGAISDCWADAGGLAVGSGRHTGGIVGRLANTVSNCYVLNASSLGSENAIAYDSWNSGTVSACQDMTGISQSAKEQFLRECGWDFAAVWDQSCDYPVLQGCDETDQIAAQS